MDAAFQPLGRLREDAVVGMAERPEVARVGALAPADVGVEVLAAGDDDLAVSHLQHVAGGETDVRAQGEVGVDVGFDATRQQQVVGIDEDDVGAPRRCQSVERGWRLPVVALPANDRNRAVFAPELVQDRGGLVGRSIVDEDALDIRIGLRRNRVEQRAQEPAVIEVDDDDADERQVDPGRGRAQSPRAVAPAAGEL